MKKKPSKEKGQKEGQEENRKGTLNGKEEFKMEQEKQTKILTKEWEGKTNKSHLHAYRSI